MKLLLNKLLTILSVVSFHLYAVEAKIHLSNRTIIGDIPIKTWKDLRDNKIEKQDEDFSCGSAAAATILRSFYGKEVYEKDILDEVIRVGDDGTASFSDLEKAVNKFGFKAVGLTLSFDKLKDIKIPAIVYPKYRNRDHFSVIRGINKKGLVWLGDPSWGNRKFSASQFKSMWETRDDNTLKGKVLLIIPKDKSLAQMQPDFFTPPKPNPIATQLLIIRD